MRALAAVSPTLRIVARVVCRGAPTQVSGVPAALVVAAVQCVVRGGGRPRAAVSLHGQVHHLVVAEHGVPLGVVWARPGPAGAPVSPGYSELNPTEPRRHHAHLRRGVHKPVPLPPGVVLRAKPLAAGARPGPGVAPLYRARLRRAALCNGFPHVPAALPPRVVHLAVVPRGQGARATGSTALARAPRRPLERPVCLHVARRAPSVVVGLAPAPRPGGSIAAIDGAAHVWHIVRAPSILVRYVTNHIGRGWDRARPV